MKVAVTTDPEVPVPPTHYGGIERVVKFLVEGLQEIGHEVTLFANEASKVSCRLFPLPGRSSQSILDTMRNAQFIYSCSRRENFDIIHSFGRLAYLLPHLVLDHRVLMTYQRTINPRSVDLALLVSRNKVRFSAVGRHMIAGLNGCWSVIPNGVDSCDYTFVPDVGDSSPLAFLGRIEEIKGVHIAISVAKSCGRDLVIMGNLEAEHQQYFNEKVLPHIDNERVRYLGSVDDETKNEVLGKAAALLMPVLWEEPFGIVMVEAMACGTPVVGFNRGAVPEVIDHGVNGFVCDDVNEMIGAIGNLHSISRLACRQAVEKNFDKKSIVTLYENEYRSVI